ncbi:MAG: putative DNA binding domain-containing protein [Synergistaceae bacterium]|jgi:predicted HTH transcriptional regulator|nr:putative DNA binding domain-containing protein [Synergistaceae bacterium]
MIEDLAIILTEGESYNVEFKESPDKELPSEVCAFANASGGKVYIGVHDLGYVVGTGIERMRYAAREANVAEPIFEFSGFFKVTFKRKAAVQSTATSDRQAIKTSDRKRVLFSYIEEHGQITASEAADLLTLSKGRVRAILQEMTKNYTIEKVGDKRYRRNRLRCFVRYFPPPLAKSPASLYPVYAFVV